MADPHVSPSLRCRICGLHLEYDLACAEVHCTGCGRRTTDLHLHTRTEPDWVEILGGEDLAQ